MAKSKPTAAAVTTTTENTALRDAPAPVAGTHPHDSTGTSFEYHGPPVNARIVELMGGAIADGHYSAVGELPLEAWVDRPSPDRNGEPVLTRHTYVLADRELGAYRFQRANPAPVRAVAAPPPDVEPAVKESADGGDE